MANRICFVELPVGALGAAKSFYENAFAFAMTDFGPEYSCTLSGGADLGPKPTFSFPGGRRFHFRDPAGNEMAAMQAD